MSEGGGKVVGMGAEEARGGQQEHRLRGLPLVKTRVVGAALLDVHQHRKVSG